ncbi:MAG: ABC-F family ATP-binding cassette domain-containing protein [Firmicutes bacterium]|nr:ABC-F family ATP-binding cassette domain-containing protein [Bacillota bacterium]
MAYKHHGAKVEATIGHKVKVAQVELNRILAHPVPRPPQPMTFTPAFAPAKPHHTVAIAVTDLAYGIEGPDGQKRPLFSDVRFTLRQGERMLLVGPNGSGKTALLDLLAARRASTEGALFRPAHTVVGYLQQCFVCADPQETLFDFFRSDLSGSRKACEELLLSYQLFTFSEFRLPVCALSPGQQRKLMIAKLMATGANLLLLDEPTNYVSFPVLEAFERALANFPGVVAVSHDRRFIERFGAPVWKLWHGHLVPRVGSP